MNTKMKHLIDPTIDFAFKVLFASKGNEPIVIHFLNSILQPVDKIISASIKNPFNEREFDTEKLSVVDVKVEDQNHHTYQIEIQLTTPKHLRQRMLYNWSQIYAKQLKKGANYNELKPVVSIWLLTANLEQDDSYHHHYQLIDEKNHKKLSDHCAIHLLELKKWQLPREIQGKLNDEDIWPFFFTHAHQWRELPEIAQVQIMERVMTVLQHISDESAQYERYIARQRSKLEELTTQENLQQLKDLQQQKQDLQQQKQNLQQQKQDLQQQKQDLQQQNEELLRKIAMLEANS